MKITIVIVIYKQLIEKSKTFQTLKQTLFNTPNIARNTTLILYDNSASRQEFMNVSIGELTIFYVHDHRNLGIATAYNYAFEKAKENGSEWILLLDHDTKLTEEFFRQLQLLDSLDKEVVAVVPRIISENVLVSPVFADTLRPLKAEKPKPGIQDTPVMAINSGTLIRVSFLKEINGFNQQFPLDYLDHWLFHEIYENGRKVWVLETVLNHELSVMDYSRVSLQRYQSILNAEINFYKNYKKDLLPAYKIQLIKRFCKQLLLVKNKKIAAYTFRRLLSM
jgi:GT2 family glycosyltransferase